MSMMDAVKSVFGKYATFSGRARRSEYWFFVLFSTLVSILLSILRGLLGGSDGGSALGMVFGFLSGIWGLAVLIPSLAVEFRRLHDTGKSGWFILLDLVPLVGWIILIVFLAADSQPGTNQYGPNPKGR